MVKQNVKENKSRSIRKNQNGGDGYVINVNEAIGGMPAFTRYSNNYRPIFEGELLQNGGDGYTVNVSPKDIGGMPMISRYTYFDAPVFNGGGCGCSSNTSSNSDPLIYDLIKLSGGKKKGKKSVEGKINTQKVTQFDAIKKISHILIPLTVGALSALITKLYLDNLERSKPKKAPIMNRMKDKIQDVLNNLSKNNLLIIAALLLLHHYAVEKKIIKKTPTVDVTVKSKKARGGESISEILSPTGVNSSGSAIVLDFLDGAFNKKRQSGGNPLKDLIAPLGTNAFIATGLLIVLERLITSKMREANKSNVTDKKVGGKMNKHEEKLFNLIAPITFNAFATESFLNKMVIDKK
jgi:hypothetical protein